MISVLGRRFPTPHVVDRGAEPVHLSACVVVVVLTLDRMPGECEQPGHAVPVRAVPGRGHGDRPRRVRGHHLHLHALGSRYGAAAERGASSQCVAESVGEPGIREKQVDEPGAGDLSAPHVGERDDTSRELLGDVARRALQRPCHPQGDVGRVVAVSWVGRALERHRHACNLGDGLTQLLQRISRQRLPHRRRGRRVFGPRSPRIGHDAPGADHASSFVSDLVLGDPRMTRSTSAPARYEKIAMLESTRAIESRRARSQRRGVPDVSVTAGSVSSGCVTLRVEAGTAGLVVAAGGARTVVVSGAA